MQAFSADVTAISGLHLAGEPMAEVYEGMDRTLTLHLVDNTGNDRLTVTRVKVSEDVPKSVFSDDEESVKTEPLPDGGILAAAISAQSHRVGVLSRTGVLTVWDSTTFDGTPPISISDLTSAATSLATHYDGSITISRPGSSNPQPQGLASIAAARPSCRITWNNLFIANATPNVFASTSLMCDQAGNGKLTGYVQQYRGSGIWAGVANWTQTETDKKMVTVIPNYTCRAWGPNDKKQYRAAALTRQLRNANGVWFGSNMISGPAETFKCK